MTESFKWQETSNKVEPKKAKNHCQMTNCRALVRYKATPTIEGADPIYVCEYHMPHWRDKNYHMSPAVKVGG